MSDDSNSATSGEYVVVARRYRPQSFDDLVGQQHVTMALRNAIKTNRVGHAYLFTGARGVGKTSAARILAKCLNCQSGPTDDPCNRCDICLSIAGGDDIDVLEIDGASNRGIDEIRQLRANVGIRPSRARFKIYIIDEVHMLTKEAFNALLKTLEEPPEHVKFIFCTTDPEKIPITVLSRCQRFDFAPIATESIVSRLQEIVAAEGATADNEALALLARRAGGSMRDSQSMLEQLIAFAGDEITIDAIHEMLGTARSHRIVALVDALHQQDAAAALGQLDAAVAEGVDVGQLAEQLLGYFRDMMAAAVGSESDLMRHSSPSEFDQLRVVANDWGVATLLAAAQTLDHVIARMRQSLQRRTLVEMALVRISQLAQLDDLVSVISAVKAGALPAAPTSTPLARKKKREPPAAAEIAPSIRPANGAASSSVAAGSSTKLTADNAAEIWDASIQQLEGLTADAARDYESIRVDGEHHLTVTLKSTYNASRCNRPEQKAALERAVADMVGQPVTVNVAVAQQATPAANQRPTTVQRPQAALIRESYEYPLVKQAIELFGADVTNVQEADEQKKET